MILKVLAAIKARHTWVEKPEAFSVRLISRYWGRYGRTPPKIMAPEARYDMTEW